MGYKENYKGVKDGVYELLPPSKYHTAVKESVVTDNYEQTGLIWQLTLQVIDGPYKGRLLWWRVNMDDKAKSWRRGAITAMGLNPESDTDLEKDVIGCRVDAEVYIDEYPKGSGKEKNKITPWGLRSAEEGIPSEPLRPSSNSTDEEFLNSDCPF